LQFLAAAISVAIEARTKSYEGYKVFEIYPNAKFPNVLRKSLKKLEKHHHVITLHHSSRTGSKIFLVSPEKADEFQTLLEKLNIPSKLRAENYQKIIDLEKKKLVSKEQFKLGYSSKSFDIDAYHSHQEILDYLESLEKKFPNLVKRFNYGKSSENRDLIGVKIGSKPDSQKGIWVDGGTHANEWITGASVLYMIDQLVNNKDTKPLTDGLNWYMVPMVNPDGYEYSRETEREWRKTRSKQAGDCIGVDPNRNFDFHWDGEGSSDDPCDVDYRGPKAFSEPEIKSLTDFWNQNAKTIQSAITLHATDKFWMLPYAYQKPAVYPPDYDELLKLAQEGEKALEAVHGEHYTVGNIVDVLYPASGSSIDYAKGVTGIKWTYAFEITPIGSGGFDLAETKIIPTGEQLFAGISVVARKVIDS